MFLEKLENRCLFSTTNALPTPDVINVKSGTSLISALKNNNRDNVTFQLNSGTYFINNDDVFTFTKQNVKIVGPLDNSATIQSNGTHTGVFHLGSLASNISFDHVTLQGPSLTSSADYNYSFFFSMDGDQSHGLNLTNLNVNSKGLIISRGGDDVFIQNVTFGPLHVYGIYTDHYLDCNNDRWTIDNVTTVGVQKEHVFRFNKQNFTKITNSNIISDKAYGLNGYWGEPIKWVSGHDNIINNCNIKGPRIQFGPVRTDEIFDPVDRMYVTNCDLPFLKLVSGSYNLRFESCVIHGGLVYDEVNDRGYAEAGFINDTFVGTKIKAQNPYRTDWLINIGYLNSSLDGNPITNKGDIPNVVAL